MHGFVLQVLGVPSTASRSPAKVLLNSSAKPLDSSIHRNPSFREGLACWKAEGRARRGRARSYLIVGLSSQRRKTLSLPPQDLLEFLS
jgi:hypothetical protein